MRRKSSFFLVAHFSPYPLSTPNNTSPISQSALEILSQVESSESGDNWSVKLNCGQLERELYAEVNEVLARLRGKWQGKMKAHLFPYDPTPLLIGVVETAIMPPKNPLAFFPTPPELVDEMIELAKLHHIWTEDDAPIRILEPSAGTGAIADGLKCYGQEAARYDGSPVYYTLNLVEIDPLNCQVLEHKGYEVQNEDFLQFAPNAAYDLVLMNPPFAGQGDQQAYITHILRAWEMLKPDGQLIAITPTGFLHNQDRRSTDFLKFVVSYGCYGRNAPQAFKASGTTINTCLIYLTKQALSWQREPRYGVQSWHLYTLQLHFDNDYQSYTALEKLVDQVKAGQYGQPTRSTGELAEGLKAAVKELYTPTIRQAWLAGDGVDPDEADWQLLYQNFAEEIAEYQAYQRRAAVGSL